LSAISGQPSAEEKREKRNAEIQRNREAEKRSYQKTIFQLGLILIICGQGIWAAGEQMREAIGRVSESQWIEDDLAQRGAALPAGTAAVLIVPENFGEVQKITIAHYVAAYGERRAVVVNSDESILDKQLERLGEPYELLVFGG
jgi:hypothetical protein